MNIVLVGCGGVWVSAIGLILKNLWYDNIVWIDSSVSQVTKNLEKHGIKVIIWHWKYKVNKNDFVIYTDAAVESPEVKESFNFMAKQDKHYHRPFSYFEFVWEISKYFKTIAVAGTHWKSTTSSMLITSLAKLNKDFALWIVGALVPQLDGNNFFINKRKRLSLRKIFDHILFWDYKNFDHKLIKKFLFAIEADEFNRHFLHLDADYAFILNMQLDHSEVYATFAEYKKTFDLFVKNVREKVYVLKTDSVTSKLLCGNKIKKLTPKKFKFKYVFGDHNNTNATFVYNMIKDLTPKQLNIKETIEWFKWLRRRMELLWKNKHWALIYTDYGHHPWELEPVYGAFSQHYKDKKLIAIFQPHQARRVIEFWDDFVKIIKKFDKKYIYNIYVARENLESLLKLFQKKALQSVRSVEQLWDLFASSCNWNYFTDFESIDSVISWADKDSVIVIFSAWDLDYKVRLKYNFL